MQNENNPINGWTEYGKLVLKELERLNAGQDKLKEDIDKKFTELNQKISEFKSTESDVQDLKDWKEKITEVWSPKQMQQSKDEVYKQKNQCLNPPSEDCKFSAPNGLSQTFHLLMSDRKHVGF